MLEEWIGTDRQKRFIKSRTKRAKFYLKGNFKICQIFL